jgi:hypothetical protein
MKKVKIMLFSLALFAVVGGALAFKAKVNKNYCTAVWDGNNCARTCPNFEGNSTTLDATNLVCTVLAPNTQCTISPGVTVDCVASTSIKPEE